MSIVVLYSSGLLINEKKKPWYAHIKTHKPPSVKQLMPFSYPNYYTSYILLRKLSRQIESLKKKLLCEVITNLTLTFISLLRWNKPTNKQRRHSFTISETNLVISIKEFTLLLACKPIAHKHRNTKKKNTISVSSRVHFLDQFLEPFYVQTGERVKI